jgi:hypothetical protein
MNWLPSQNKLAAAAVEEEGGNGREWAARGKIQKKTSDGK